MNFKNITIKTATCVLSSGLMLSSLGCGSGIDSGEGKKIGQIVKIGQHGVFCSTYEAEIIRGGLNGGTGVNGLALDFSIKEKKLYEQLVEVMEKQQEIELSYTRATMSGPCYSETGIFATGFKVLNGGTNADSANTNSTKIDPTNENKIDYKAEYEKIHNRNQ